MEVDWRQKERLRTKRVLMLLCKANITVKQTTNVVSKGSRKQIPAEIQGLRTEEVVVDESKGGRNKSDGSDILPDLEGLCIRLMRVCKG